MGGGAVWVPDAIPRIRIPRLRYSRHEDVGNNLPPSFAAVGLGGGAFAASRERLQCQEHTPKT